MYACYYYTKLTYVRPSVRRKSPEAILSELKRSFLCKARAGRYVQESTDTASKGISSRLKEELLQSVEQK